MAERFRTKNNGRNTPVTPRSDKEKLLRVILVVFCTIAVTVLLIFSLFGLKRLLFTRNPRLTLREVVTDTVGFWENREKMLADRLGLKTGDNLFDVDIRKTRQKLMSVPNVESCEVIRVLPDQIMLKITERIPRAILQNPRSPWVVDENGIVIPRRESICALQQMSLPILLGIPQEKIKSGSRCEDLKPALDLIMLTVRNFPDIEVRVIEDADNLEKLKFHIRYRQSKTCTVTMPVCNENDMNFLLLALQSAILQSEHLRDSSRYFDLSFDGRVVIK